VPRTSKTGSGSGSKPEDLSYEDALKKLEELVESMESGDLPLESLLSRFEKGTRLAQLCQSKLAEAELRIQKLEQNAKGDLELKPFDTGPAANP
jgi:exodeoxyribonuclease VII small subunit